MYLIFKKKCINEIETYYCNNGFSERWGEIAEEEKMVLSPQVYKNGLNGMQYPSEV